MSFKIGKKYEKNYSKYQSVLKIDNEVDFKDCIEGLITGFSKNFEKVF